jgi:hypothetical protein
LPARAPAWYDTAKETAMIELTDEQWRQLRGPEPIQLRDPHTQETYVLIKTELYESMRRLLTRQAPAESDPEVAPGIRRSREAFLRALPDLLRNPKLDRWYAAYHGAQRVGIARSAADLYRKCSELGLRDDEFYLGVIRPHEQEPEDLEPSLLEYEDPEPSGPRS